MIASWLTSQRGGYHRSSELELLDEYELSSKFCTISNAPARTVSATMDCPMVLASLENVERPLARQMVARKRVKGPKFGRRRGSRSQASSRFKSAQRVDYR